jgi:hypothetical protein
MALLSGPPPRRRALAGAVAAMALSLSAAVLVASVQTEARFEAAESAYTTTH